MARHLCRSRPHSYYGSVILSSQAPVSAALVSTRRVYDELASVYLPVAVGVFGLFAGLIVVVVLRYRGRSGVSGRSESNVLEGSYAVLLACVVGFLLFLTLRDEHKIDTVANQERPSVVVDVTAAKWEWEFRYPGRGIVAHSGTVGHEPLVVPADRAVRFNLRSRDVIHSLWIPQLRFKRDLIHGTTEHVTLTFTRTGVFGGQCAEFCGLRHAEMTFSVRVMSPLAFGRWAAAHRGGTT